MKNKITPWLVLLQNRMYRLTERYSLNLKINMIDFLINVREDYDKNKYL
jgi:hypothetical protein